MQIITKILCGGVLIGSLLLPTNVLGRECKQSEVVVLVDSSTEGQLEPDYLYTISDLMHTNRRDRKRKDVDVMLKDGYKLLQVVVKGNNNFWIFIKEECK